MPANSANSTLNFGYNADPGNTAVAVGAITGGYNIDFTTYRDIYPNQVGARIRAERLNNYYVNNALIQSMELAFYSSDGVQPSNLGERMRINVNGNIGIGTSNPQSLLAVSGTITTKQVNITITGWSDFVFDSTYQKLSLESVSRYISQYKHLPQIPSTAELEKAGLDLGAMQKLHMQKIEELTLYANDANQHAKQQDTLAE